ncbi:MAG TPA: MBL fold metallo-hydrolase [Thermoleophilaceae bacterium]|nr:MBL fold metallo-hydrolase [Thermoleophilaceae bacterium]
MSGSTASAGALTYVGHATVLVERDGVRLLTDPVLRGRVVHLRRQGGPVDIAALGRIDAVLISHTHRDHLDVPSLRQVASPDVTVVVPPGTGEQVASIGFGAIRELAVGTSTKVDGLQITATPARHDSARHPFGTPGESVGYLIGAHRSAYFAGDTDLFPEMAELAGRIDVALLPVWGWGPTLGAGHLSPERAARALTLLRPRVAVPIHWGTLFPVGLARLRAPLLYRPPHEFAHAAARLAPAVDVRVLVPGESTRL